MRLALLVGIDDYLGHPLKGCVADATRMTNVLRTHHNGDPNFDCRTLLAPPQTVTRALLRQALEELFTKKADVAMFYFAGHGARTERGEIAVTPDRQPGDEGVTLNEVLAYVARSPSQDKLVVLDSCYAGGMGNLTALHGTTIVPEGVTILAACRDVEAADETAGGGIFTDLLLSALEGGAADLSGNVTVTSLHAYADAVLSGWQQRPMLKIHVSRLLSLRKCAPVVPVEVLRLLPTYFPEPDSRFRLDPSYEPEAKPRHPEHEKVFGHLQALRNAQLLVPVKEKHLYHAAMKSGGCKLTQLGRFYWQRVKAGRL